MIDNQYGFIDKNGNQVIPLEYDYARGFSECGLAVVSKNGLVGAIDTNGNEVIPFIYQSISDFSADGVAWVVEGKKHGIIECTVQN
jgi:hypothetical protein